MPYHFGKEIKKAIEDRGMSVAEFARRCEMSRENAYDVFKRKDIDTDLMRTVSAVLSRDFLSESMTKTKKESWSEYQKTIRKELQTMQEQIDKLHGRVELLEEALVAVSRAKRARSRKK